MNEEDTICLLRNRKNEAIICQHLFEMNNVGYNVPCDVKTDTEAWCDGCEIILNEEGEWNDRALNFANFKGCCINCFIKVKNQNFII